MIELNTLIGFALASFAIAISPGPSWIYVIASTIDNGRSGGLVAVAGNGSGIVVHTLMAVLGLSAIIYISALAFGIVKWIGVVYLVYLAVKTIRNRGTIAKSAASTGDGLKKVFRNGMLVNIFNPKASLLMYALLPQFVDAHEGNIVYQLSLLGVMHVAIASTVLTALTFSCHFFSHAFEGSIRTQKVLRWLSGTLLFGFALKLAVAQRN